MGRPRKLWKLDGHDYEFRAAFEVDIAEQLIDYQEDYDFEWSYESETIAYVKPANGHCNDCSGTDIVTHHNYTADFDIRFPTGKVFYLESKGFFKSRDRTKYIELRKSTGLDLRFVFQSDGWLTKARKTSYTRWCTQKKFESSILDIPEDWFHE